MSDDEAEMAALRKNSRFARAQNVREAQMSNQKEQQYVKQKMMNQARRQVPDSNHGNGDEADYQRQQTQDNSTKFGQQEPQQQQKQTGPQKKSSYLDDMYDEQDQMFESFQKQQQMDSFTKRKFNKTTNIEQGANQNDKEQSESKPASFLAKNKSKSNRFDDLLTKFGGVHDAHKRRKIDFQRATTRDQFEIDQEEYAKKYKAENDEEEEFKQGQLKDGETIVDNQTDALDDDQKGMGFKIPDTNEVFIDGHDRMIQTIALDKTGTKMITGCVNYKIKIWDFSSMNKTLKAFREFKPFDGHPVSAISFSPDSEKFLCCCGNNQAKVYTVEGGRKVQTTIKGDMYIHDMNNTKGHISSITDGKWHPKNNNLFITASTDGTIRQWDLESKSFGVEKQLVHQTILKTKQVTGQKAQVISCCYSHKGEFVAAGCNDGSIQIWDIRQKNLYRPETHMQRAHAPMSEVSCVQMTRDSLKMFSRSMDDTMKMWDLRKPTEPVFTWENLINLSSKTNVTLSTNEKVVLTGTSVRKGYGYGVVAAYDTISGEKLKDIPMSQHSVIQVNWHHQLNQIFVGSADGNIRVLYDPQVSRNGVMNCIVKPEKRRTVEGQAISQTIFTPASHGKDDSVDQRKIQESQQYSYISEEVIDPKKLKDRRKQEPKPVKKAEMPLQGPGRGGRMTQSGTLAQYVMQSCNKNTQRDMDPREALLRYAKESEQNPMWVAPAYQKTQPKAVFNMEQTKIENLRFLESTESQKCKHCGLKFCTCKDKQ